VEGPWCASKGDWSFSCATSRDPLFVSWSAMALGLSAFAGVASGGVTIEGISAGAITFGGMAFGDAAMGGMARNDYAAGGGPKGKYILSSQQDHSEALEFLDETLSSTF
jgi:hypothetical protein